MIIITVSEFLLLLLKTLIFELYPRGHVAVSEDIWRGEGTSIYRSRPGTACCAFYNANDIPIQPQKMSWPWMSIMLKVKALTVVKGVP